MANISNMQRIECLTEWMKGIKNKSQECKMFLNPHLRKVTNNNGHKMFPNPTKFPVEIKDDSLESDLI